MRFSTSDFPLVRWNILAICASLLISALVLYSSGEYAEKTKKDRRDAQSQVNEARNRLTAAQDDQKNMAIYADEYGVLIERNIIGDDHRLDGLTRTDRQIPHIVERLVEQHIVRRGRCQERPRQAVVRRPIDAVATVH